MSVKNALFLVLKLFNEKAAIKHLNALLNTNFKAAHVLKVSFKEAM